MRQICWNTQVARKKEKRSPKDCIWGISVVGWAQPAVKYVPRHLLTPLTSLNRKSKSKKPYGFRWRQLNKWRKEKKKEEKKKKWCKGSHSPSPKTKPIVRQASSSIYIGRQNLPSPSSTSGFYCCAWPYIIWTATSLPCSGQLSLVYPLSAPCPPQAYSLLGQSGKKREPWWSASTAQR